MYDLNTCNIYLMDIIYNLVFKMNIIVSIGEYG